MVFGENRLWSTNYPLVFFLLVMVFRGKQLIVLPEMGYRFLKFGMKWGMENWIIVSEMGSVFQGFGGHTLTKYMGKYPHPQCAYMG